MDRESLEQLLERGLSLHEIGQRFGRHEATVAHWVEKHGLRAANREKHAARGALAREELERLVASGASIAEIAQAVGRSKATVRHWLGRYGLKTSGTAGRGSRAGSREALEAGLQSISLKCPRHGKTEHVRERSRYYRCRLCRQEAVVRRRRKVKEILVREAGGGCRLCGYDRCMAALEFHHLERSAKEFGLARRGAHSIELLRVEASKCVLLCSNCHAEVEAGIRRLA